jgi:hypothetical protein
MFLNGAGGLRRGEKMCPQLQIMLVFLQLQKDSSL